MRAGGVALCALSSSIEQLEPLQQALSKWTPLLKLQLLYVTSRSTPRHTIPAREAHAMLSMRLPYSLKKLFNSIAIVQHQFCICRALACRASQERANESLKATLE